MLKNLPQRVLRAPGPLASQFHGDISDDSFKTRVRMSAGQQVFNLLA